MNNFRLRSIETVVNMLDFSLAFTKQEIRSLVIVKHVSCLSWK